jgi:tungstate transport system ATP-binding protein
MTDTLLELEKVVHSYAGRQVLEVERLEVKEGEMLVVLGQTGTGKSTLLRVLNLLEQPEQGVIRWRGQELPANHARLEIRRRIAMAFQDPLLFRASVFDNVAYGLRLRHRPKTEIEEKVGKILGLFKIGHLATRNPNQTSGGEAQRVALARALVIEPDLLLLDEPLASLDPVIKEELAKDLIEVLHSLNVSCVYVTHSREEAFMVADRVAIIEQGKIAQIGDLEDVFYRPASVSVAGFVGVDTIIKGEVTEQEKGLAVIRIDHGQIEAITEYRPGDKVFVCIRPEDIVVESFDSEVHAGHKASARNHLKGKVTGIRTLGAIAKVNIDCGAPLVATITKRSLDDLGIKKDDEVIASFKATSVHVIKSEVIPPPKSSPLPAGRQA